MAFTASAPADQSISHRLADTVKGGELSYMALAMEREQIVYRSLLMRSGARRSRPTLRRSQLDWYAAASLWPSLLACLQINPATASCSYFTDYCQGRRAHLLTSRQGVQGL